MRTVLNIGDRIRPAKSWGWEEWIVNNDLYCGKRLHFTKLDGSTSLHFHAKKHETMYVESGSFLITLIDTKTGEEVRKTLSEGESIIIKPLMPHRIRALRLHDYAASSRVRTEVENMKTLIQMHIESPDDKWLLELCNDVLKADGSPPLEAVLVEFSTHHENSDSYRVSP